MNCFISTNTDIFYNLALEEFLLKQTREDFFFLWRSNPVVVVGKHQNPYKELDYFNTVENQIPVARRLSGGGTVYQDLGNVNFTIIKNTRQGKQINLKEHSKPVFDALRTLGIGVEYSKRNDFLLNGKKISGNAEHVHKNRILHHGTLLYDADLNVLRSVLRNKPQKYLDKTVASFSSSVVNIKQSLVWIEETQGFVNLLFRKVLSLNPTFKKNSITSDSEILELKNNKYSSKEWIFLYTPKYELKNEFIYQNTSCSISLSVLKGIIQNAEIKGLESINSKLLESKLQNRAHLLDEIEPLLKTEGEDLGSIIKEFF